jgi:hypothetical protein
LGSKTPHADATKEYYILSPISDRDDEVVAIFNRLDMVMEFLELPIAKNCRLLTMDRK